MFELTRSRISDTAVWTLTIVVDFDVFENRPSHRAQSGPGVQMNEFLLDGRVERFGHGIVVTNTGMTDRRNDTVRQRESAEVDTRVLTAAVGMNDDIPDSRPLPLDRHPQRVGDQA